MVLDRDLEGALDIPHPVAVAENTVKNALPGCMDPVLLTKHPLISFVW
jgi:hypothetical protein